MNPYMHILQSLQRKAGVRMQPQQVSPGTNPNTGSMFRPLTQLQGTHPGYNSFAPLTAQAQAVLQRPFANPAQQPNSSIGAPSPQISQQTAPNPYLALLQQRLGITQPRPQQQQQNVPGQAPGVMTGNFNSQSLVIPTKQIPNSLAMDPTKQQEGDLIK